MPSNERHPLIELIKSEHLAIANVIFPAQQSFSWTKIQWLWENAENLHHLNEEHLLYSEIQKSPRLLEGGPYCVYFYEEQIQNPPVVRVNKLLTEISGNIVSVSKPDTKLPIDIPTTEHRCLNSLIDFTLKNRDTISSSQLRSILDLYSDINSSHTKKEEKCFFKMCTQILLVQQLDTVFAKWRPVSQFKTH